MNDSVKTSLKAVASVSGLSMSDRISEPVEFLSGPTPLLTKYLLLTYLHKLLRSREFKILCLRFLLFIKNFYFAFSTYIFACWKLIFVCTLAKFLVSLKAVLIYARGIGNNDYYWWPWVAHRYQKPQKEVYRTHCSSIKN